MVAVHLLATAAFFSASVYSAPGNVQARRIVDSIRHPNREINNSIQDAENMLRQVREARVAQENIRSRINALQETVNEMTARLDQRQEEAASLQARINAVHHGTVAEMTAQLRNVAASAEVQSSTTNAELQQLRVEKFQEWKRTHHDLLAKQQQQSDDSVECGICQEAISRNAECLTKLKTCPKHNFCYNCISTWYDRTKKRGESGVHVAKCPTCREKYGEDDIVPDMFGKVAVCDTACGLENTL